MAKFVGNVVVIEGTNLSALFYYKYLCESYNKEVKYPPVQYYDEIDKNGIENTIANDLVAKKTIGYSSLDDIYKMLLDNVNNIIEEVSKTTYHGFKYNVIHENVKDEGLAKKQMQAIQKQIKNHEEPFNNIFKTYNVTIIQG